MITFLKANVASLTASALDYVVTILLVTIFKLDPVIASVTGTFCGGILNFIIGRNWVFKSKEAKMHHQAFKYGIVWVGNLILNAGGMWWLVKIVQLNYVISKVIVSVLVGFFYNYLLQKKYVFR